MEHLPTAELVIRDGKPVWLMQCGDVEVQHIHVATAMRMFHQECLRRGLTLPAGNEAPRRGPSDSDEPGV